MALENILTWAEIDLDAIISNTSNLRAHVGENTELMAAVKANAYGHGAVPVARAVLEGGATRLAVHRTLAGVQLRQAGITAPILIMGYTLPAESECIVRWDLTPTVNSRPQAEALAAAAEAQGKMLPVHVNLDTGMSRYGLLPDEVLGFVRFVNKLPGLVLEGLYTHHAVAELADKTFARHQFSIFMDVVRHLEAAGFAFPLKHVSNSAAALDLPEMALDMIRCGIVLYGLYPSDEVKPIVSLRPALTLKSRVTRVCTLPTGASISYGRTFIVDKPTRVALIPVGYGDGYHRLLSNRGIVLIHGQRAPIVGRVCMDQFVVDVSHIPAIQLHDEVVLIGQQGQEQISAEEVACWAETINYEVITSLLPRVVRIYLREGKETERTAP